MTEQSRPAGMHPDTWTRLLRASHCAGYPPPPLIQTTFLPFSPIPNAELRRPIT